MHGQLPKSGEIFSCMCANLVVTLWIIRICCFNNSYTSFYRVAEHTGRSSRTLYFLSVPQHSIVKQHMQYRTCDVHIFIKDFKIICDGNFVNDVCISDSAETEPQWYPDWTPVVLSRPASKGNTVWKKGNWPVFSSLSHSRLFISVAFHVYKIIIIFSCIFCNYWHLLILIIFHADFISLMRWFSKRS